MKSVAVAAALLVAACGASHQPSGSGSGDVVAPGAAKSPDVGAPAVDGSVLRASGTPIALADTWRGHRATVLVFYRGFF